MFPPAQPPASGIEAVDAFPNINEQAEFGNVLYMTHAGDGSGRLFVVGRTGVIHVVQGFDAAGSTVFMDMSSEVSAEGEGGLLAIAFHPDYANTGRFFASYTARLANNDFVSRLSEFTVDPTNPDAGLLATEASLLEVDQFATNHNGGMLAFGPDGFLYWSLGDGGGARDPQANGQNPQTLLGTILRLDVDTPNTPGQYAIPDGNAFDDVADGLPEIYAWGFRNPWRFSFDRETDELWVADVGQNAREEVNVVVAGGNYGWDRTEGLICHEPATNCDPDGEFIRPVFDYPRNVGESITGGYVYRGTQQPGLYGNYVFADFDLNRVFVYVPGRGVFRRRSLRPEQRHLVRGGRKRRALRTSALR